MSTPIVDFLGQTGTEEDHDSRLPACKNNKGVSSQLSHTFSLLHTKPCNVLLLLYFYAAWAMSLLPDPISRNAPASILEVSSVGWSCPEQQATQLWKF